MAKKPNNRKPAYKQSVIDVDKIKPSPYQVRRFFDEDKKKGLAQSIQRDGLIQPIVVRRKNGHSELIAGERRVQAIRDYTGIKSLAARVVEASDIQARRIAAAENFQREDLTAIESVEAIVELIDAELIEDKQYASMGKSPTDRVKTLLGKLDSLRASKKRGSRVSSPSKQLFHSSVEQLEEIFKSLPKPLEWRSFYNHHLPILLDINEEVRKVSNQNRLTRAQIRALKKLKDVSPEEFQRVTGNGRESSKTVIGSKSKKSTQVDLKDLSSREIEGIAEKAAKKKSLTELNRPRVSPSFKEAPAIVMMSRMRIPAEGISA